MTLRAEVRRREPLALDFLLLDVNGTLGDRGLLLEGVAERLAVLRAFLEPRLVSSDTFGTLAGIAETLSLPAEPAASGEEKLAILRRLGPDRCAVIGNGANDALVLAAAALGIAVLGREGASGAALAAADVVCGSVLDALDLLGDPQALVATLRP